MWNDDFPAYGKEAYRMHNEAVRREAKDAGRELLQFDVKEGWKLFCEFLGKEVPEGVDFPRVDDWKEYKARRKDEEEKKRNDELKNHAE
jgi:hypothetical protein